MFVSTNDKFGCPLSLNNPRGQDEPNTSLGFFYRTKYVGNLMSR